MTAAPKLSEGTEVSLDEVKSMSKVALTKAEVARALDVDVRTVTRAIADGSIPVVRIGRRTLIPRLPFLALFGADEE